MSLNPDPHLTGAFDLKGAPLKAPSVDDLSVADAMSADSALVAAAAVVSVAPGLVGGSRLFDVR